MQRADRALVLDPDAQRDELAGVEVLEERRDVVLMPSDGGIEPDLADVWQEALEPVIADVDELVEPDEPAGVLSPPTRHAADRRVAPGERRENVPCIIGHRHLVGARGDRGERPVDVAEDCRGPRVDTQRT